MDKIKKKLSAEIDLPEGSRSFVAKITSDAVDRDGEVLLPEGMDATDFEKNPVVYLNHDYSTLPIGSVTALKRQKDHWLATVKMAERPDGHVGEWVPDTVLALVKQGVIKGVSIGADATQRRRATQKDIETFGDDVHTVISRWKLFELSVAPLPANQEALIMAVAKSVQNGDCSKEFAEALAPEAIKRKLTITEPRRTVKLFVPDVQAKAKEDRQVRIKRMVESETKKQFAKAKGLLYIP